MLVFSRPFFVKNRKVRQKPTPAKSEIFGRRNWGGLRGIWSCCDHWLTNTYFEARNGTRFAVKMLKNAPKNAPGAKSEILNKVPKTTKIVEKLASKMIQIFPKNCVGDFFFQNFAFRKKSLHRNFTVREHPWPRLRRGAVA